MFEVRRAVQGGSTVNRHSIVLTCIGLAAATAAVLTPIATAGKRTGRPAATVAVSGKEYMFTPSSISVSHGTVTFRFTNRGKIGHDLNVDGKTTPVINPGKTAAITVSLKKGTYRFICTVTGHAKLGMRGTLKVK
jgi:plastocyanin